MNYRREIDGLRSVAVLPVIFFHAGITVFSGGYIGVDVFFVISGYLITSIIVSERANNAFTLRNFYERRARRILPALFFVIIVCIPFAWAWMSPSQLQEFAQSLAAVALFSSNILFWSESGYFAPVAELKPLLHTWSLAIEEQYYLFFPLFILATWRLGGKAIFVALLLLSGISLLLSQWASANHPSANFYLLPTRLWELLVGSLIALYLLNKKAVPSQSTGNALYIDQLFSGIGLALILYSIFAFDDQTPFPGFYALVPTLGTALVILFASKGTLTAMVLGSKLPVAIGLISYSAYLWHQPLFAFTRIRSVSEPSPTFMVLIGLLSLGLAAMTWRYVEKPFRDKSRFSRPQIFYAAAIASTALIGLGLWGHLSNGLPTRTNSAGATFAELNLDHRIRPNRGLNKACDFKFTLSDECRTGNPPDILVWGDSFAIHLIQGILSSNSDAAIIQLTKSACAPVIGLAPERDRIHGEAWSEECLKFNDSVSLWIKENTSLRYAVLSSPFERYLENASQLRYAGNVTGSNESILYTHFSATLDFLVSQGIQPVVFAPPPSIGHDKNIGACLFRSAIFNEEMEKCDISAADYHQNMLKVIAFLKKIEKKYRVIWIDDFLCTSEKCRTSIDGQFIYQDAVHLSYEGSALVGSRMNFYELITAPSTSE
ncbi:acyltransferase [Halieaceae bacterium IMCC14734]|uniref:Acyltransferase n=1 Tax=Candidatus Litorirhabdus singularis TaxID=2518993 RepID=A0ABT3TLA5_9GAMM|nr:acyltransferase family protein [Candidatus Litorirhabdus singularis]MCX2983046.1 acyltransferase [Candidatus Litorirhabdus singularis]